MSETRSTQELVEGVAIVGRAEIDSTEAREKVQEDGKVGVLGRKRVAGDIETRGDGCDFGGDLGADPRVVQLEGKRVYMIDERLAAGSEKGVEKDFEGIWCANSDNQNRCPVEQGLRDGVNAVGGSGYTDEVRGRKIRKDFEENFIRDVANERHDE